VGADDKPPPIGDAGPPPPHEEKAKAAPTPTEVRIALLNNGYMPTPLQNGKEAFLTDWGNRNADRREIEGWARSWPERINTGCLTRFTPALDLDLYDVDAAEACELFVKDFFDDERVLVRIGQLPKRAFMFRTDKPFKKILRVFKDSTGREHGIELLCAGQQLAVDGIHPKTGKPYFWHGGKGNGTCALVEVPREELPAIDENTAREVVDALTKLVTEKFGLTLIKRKTKIIKRQDKTYEVADEDELIDCIAKGAALHDSPLSLAGKWARSGRYAGPNEEADILARLQELMQGSAAKETDPGRWQSRFDDLGRTVRDVLAYREKRKAEEAEAAVKAAEAEAQAQAKEAEEHPFGPQQPPPPDEGPPLEAYEEDLPSGATLEDFYAYLPDHRFIYLKNWCSLASHNDQPRAWPHRQDQRRKISGVHPPGSADDMGAGGANTVNPWPLIT
jgi:hypothetical protein